MKGLAHRGPHTGSDRLPSLRMSKCLKKKKKGSRVEKETFPVSVYANVCTAGRQEMEIQVQDVKGGLISSMIWVSQQMHRITEDIVPFLLREKKKG